MVGRRRHADLTGWDPERLVRWLAGDGPGPDELTEPEWLRDGYAASRDLLDADERSYRFVISAVCGLSRDLFAELGGSSPEFTGYGGEDWELAHRAWVAGALLAHVPEAVAWHDGPDWADRDVARTRGQERRDPPLAAAAARPGGPGRRAVAALPRHRGHASPTRARTPPWPPPAGRSAATPTAGSG